MKDEEYLYFVRKLRPFWGTKRYEYTSFTSAGRARGAVKSSIRQGHRPLEAIKIFRVPIMAFEEIESYEAEDLL